MGVKLSKLSKKKEKKVKWKCTVVGLEYAKEKNNHNNNNKKGKHPNSIDKVAKPLFKSSDGLPRRRELSADRIKDIVEREAFDEQGHQSCEHWMLERRPTKEEKEEGGATTQNRESTDGSTAKKEEEVKECSKEMPSTEKDNIEQKEEGERVKGESIDQDKQEHDEAAEQERQRSKQNKQHKKMPEHLEPEDRGKGTKEDKEQRKEESNDLEQQQSEKKEHPTITEVRVKQEAKRKLSEQMKVEEVDIIDITPLYKSKKRTETEGSREEDGLEFIFDDIMNDVKQKLECYSGEEKKEREKQNKEEGLVIKDKTENSSGCGGECGKKEETGKREENKEASREEGKKEVHIVEIVVAQNDGKGRAMAEEEKAKSAVEMREPCQMQVMKEDKKGEGETCETKESFLEQTKESEENKKEEREKKAADDHKPTKEECKKDVRIVSESKEKEGEERKSNEDTNKDAYRRKRANSVKDLVNMWEIKGKENSDSKEKVLALKTSSSIIHNLKNNKSIIPSKDKVSTLRSSDSSRSKLISSPPSKGSSSTSSYTYSDISTS